MMRKISDNRDIEYNKIKEIAGENLLSNFNHFANTRTLLTFACIECSQQYATTAFLYVSHENNRLCHTCRTSVPAPNNLQFITDFTKVHGDYYNYDKLPSVVTLFDPITIGCPKHGDITLSAFDHLSKGCDICKTENTFDKTERKQSTSFVVQANTKHDFKYRYDNIKFVDATTPVSITCPKHGDFTQSPQVHLDGGECAICGATSKPILQIMEALDAKNILYAPEKKFTKCIGMKGKVLRFDLFIPQFNLCIEYDGIHHFHPTKYYTNITDEQANRYLEIQQENDKIKDEFCKQESINFIRIPYTEYDPAGVVTDFISNYAKQERIIHTWEDFGDDVRHMINYINSFNYDRFVIYGISRGGLPHAVHVSNHFEDQGEFGIINFQRYDGNSKTAEISIGHKGTDLPIFVIDDLISSGETMDQVVDKLKSTYPNVPVHPIVIYGNENEKGVFWLRDHPRQWIVFPYEI